VLSELAEAIRAPLAFALEHPEAAGRTAALRDSLLEVLERGIGLAIPPETRARLEQARKIVENEWPEADAPERAHAALAPLLEADYCGRVLSERPERVRGVGPKAARALGRKGIRTLEDLLFFLPRAYDDRRELVPIGALHVGQPACFEGRVTRAGSVRLPRGRRFFQAVVADASGAVQLKWFRGIAFFEERVRPGVRVLVAGDVRRYRYSKELHHPEIELLEEQTTAEQLARIVPVYSAVEGLPPRTLRRLVADALDACVDLVEAHLPEGAVAELGLPSLGESLRQVHRPGVHLEPEELQGRRTPYHRRLVAEELFLLQVGLAQRRARAAERATKPLPTQGPEMERALAALPFRLTRAQERVLGEIRGDLARPRPMNRLLVGDVGSGKTVLAFLAAVAARAAGGMTAVLAPTELLAEQHANTLRALARPLGISVSLLTGSTPAPERRQLRRLLRLGEIGIVVGTHALLSQSVTLPELRLVVIDEQHRFGVEQRQQLPRKGESPHLLVMTATPIPRTLALTLYGDLDHSELDELPPGRRPVATRVIEPARSREAFAELQRALARGERAYVVYPLVEESEKQDLQDATRGFERLRAALPGFGVELVHGRMDAAARGRAMHAFAGGRARVLVSTTVIEVGVDVPEATLLVVQHAERFGLAQLHQLRGRVGRGSRPGLAVLIADARSEEAALRLAVLERSQSGFEIAETDLRLRGAGEWLGTRQTGHVPDLRLLDLARHGELLSRVRSAAFRLVEVDPGLVRHPRLRKAVDRHWGPRLSYGGVA
jgi:ATP-dependent DNA helicase RecG